MTNSRVARSAVFVVAVSLAMPSYALDFGALLSGWLETMNQKVSGIKVVAKQKAAAADKVAAATLQSHSAAATAFVTNRQAQLTREAVQKFSDQGVHPCFQNDVAVQTGETIDKSRTSQLAAAAKMVSVDYGKSSDRNADQITLHKAAYCSVSEAKAGLCKLNALGLQSANSDFAFLAKSGTKGKSERSAGYDFVDNIMPPRQAVACRSAECAAQAADIRTVSAFESLARNSLMTMIESRSVQAAVVAN